MQRCPDGLNSVCKIIWTCRRSCMMFLFALRIFMKNNLLYVGEEMLTNDIKSFVFMANSRFCVHMNVIVQVFSWTNKASKVYKLLFDMAHEVM